MLDSEFKKLKEDTRHGDLLLPFTKYNTIMPMIFTSFPMHWHEEVEIIVVKKGRLWVSIDLDNILAEEGDIIILKPYSLHAFKQYEKEDTFFQNIVFNLNLINNNIADSCNVKYLNPFLENKVTYPRVIKKKYKEYERVYNCLEELIMAYEKKEDFFELKIKSEVFNLFYILFKYFFKTHNYSPVLKDDVTKNLKVVLEYIQENYMNTISINNLSSIVNFSDHYFMKFFKKNMGVTAVDYINDYRLNVATKLLTTTDLSISEIGINVGIPNISYFNRVFKKKYELTPKEYRKKIINEI